MNSFFENSETCILLQGQVRLSDSVHDSFSEMINHHKYICGQHDISMHLWEQDYQKYKEEINAKDDFVVCNELEPLFSDEEIESFKKTVINWGCDPNIAERAVLGLIKEGYGLGQSINKALEKDYKYFIKTRYDLYYKNKFYINKYEIFLCQNFPVIIMPHGNWGFTNIAKGCQNMFYVMNRPAAETLKDFHLSQLKRAQNNQIVGSEAGLRDHFKEINAKLYRINFPVTSRKWLDVDVWYSPDFEEDNYLIEERV